MIHPDLYSNKTNLLIAFHGCDEDVFDAVIRGGEELNFSHNDYDWLGGGIYFWEANYERALEWAELHVRKSGKKPAVIGAVIDLGYCMDLTQAKYLQTLRLGYKHLCKLAKKNNTCLPENIAPEGASDTLLRRLDCSVIEAVHETMKEAGVPGYDSVRGMFLEGPELYPGAGFREKNHLQICVRNPNCIKGYFAPKGINNDFVNP